MKIEIKFYDHEDELSEQMDAYDVLDAEGKLAIMGRRYQKRVEKWEACYCRKCGEVVQCKFLHSLSSPHYQSLCENCI